MKQPQQQRYNLVWIVNGKVKETIILNGSLALAKWKAKELKGSTHRMGLLQPRKIN